MPQTDKVANKFSSGGPIIDTREVSRSVDGSPNDLHHGYVVLQQVLKEALVYVREGGKDQTRYLMIE